MTTVLSDKTLAEQRAGRQARMVVAYTHHSEMFLSPLKAVVNGRPYSTQLLRNKMADEITIEVRLLTEDNQEVILRELLADFPSQTLLAKVMLVV